LGGVSGNNLVRSGQEVVDIGRRSRIGLKVSRIDSQARRDSKKYDKRYKHYAAKKWACFQGIYIGKMFIAESC